MRISQIAAFFEMYQGEQMTRAIVISEEGTAQDVSDWNIVIRYRKGSAKISTANGELGIANIAWSESPGAEGFLPVIKTEPTKGTVTFTVPEDFSEEVLIWDSANTVECALLEFSFEDDETVKQISKTFAWLVIRPALEYS